jgi:hypothetical protein
MTTNIGYDDKFPPGTHTGRTSLASQSEKDLTMETKPDTVANTLDERGTRYGKFSGHALIAQTLKDEMHCTLGWERLSRSQAEALDMIAHKIARILNGDPNYADSWHDIAGYASLIDNQLNGKDI